MKNAIKLLLRPLASGGGGGGFLAIGDERAIAFDATTSEDRIDGIFIGSQSNGKQGLGATAARARALYPEIINIRRSDRGHFWQAAEPLEDNGAGRIERAPGYDASTALASGWVLPMIRVIRTYEPGLLRGNRVAVFAVRVGGTGFSKGPGPGGTGTDPAWRATPGDEGNLYLDFVAGIQTIMTNYPQIRPRYCGISIGEQDTVNGVSQALYETDETDFGNYLRAAVSVPDLVIVTTVQSIEGLSGGVSGNAVFKGQKNYKNLLAYTGLVNVEANSQSGYGSDTGTGQVGVSDETSPVTNNGIHFSDETQNDALAPRHIAGWKAAEDNNNPGGAMSAQSAPAAPTSLVLTPHDGYASVAFTAGANNGAPIHYFESRISTDGGANWSMKTGWLNGPSTGRLLNLTNGTTYTVQVRAVNKIGPSAWSSSATVTPAANDLTTGLSFDICVRSGALIDAMGNTLTVNVNSYGIDVLTEWAKFTSGGHRITLPIQLGLNHTLHVWRTASTFASGLRGWISAWASDTTTLRHRDFYNGIVGANARYLDSQDASLLLTMDSTLDLDVWHLLTRRQTDIGGGNVRVDYLKDGVLFDTGGTVAAPTYAAGDLISTGYANGGAASNNSLSGNIHRMIGYANKAQSDIEVAAVLAKGRTGASL